MIKQMYKIVSLALIAGLAVGCSSKGNKGELVGTHGKKWYPEQPYGMVLIPGGAFIMGNSDDDIANLGDSPNKTATVRSFYMDDTEITNNEYRSFIEWVKDSTTRHKLAKYADELGMTSTQPTGRKGKATVNKKGGTTIGDYAFNDANPDNMTPYEKYMQENYYSIGTEEDEYAGRRLNRGIALHKETSKYPDEYYVEVMDSLYLPPSESYNGLRIMDVEKLVFRYTWMDIQAAAKAKKGKRSQFVKTENIKVYPDTTTWIKDFAYSYNEPMHNDYFWHSAYGDYPVVGVSWKQAKAFCAWRTLFKNTFIKSLKNKRDLINSFRLPTEAEWEYAARGGLESATYPWGSLYPMDDRGCFMANFKPSRGDYAADGFLYTVEAKSFEPNGYKLYNMAGNVSEWVDSSYDAAAYEFVSSMNPNVSDLRNFRKVVRGGSWKDVSYFLKCGVRDFEYADSSRSYIGFRTVQDYMGTQITGTGKRK